MAESINIMWHIHAMEYYLVVRRNDICYNIKEPGIHYAKQKKPDAKWYILYHSIYRTYPE